MKLHDENALGLFWKALPPSETTERPNARPISIALVDDDESVCATLSEIAREGNWKLKYYPDGNQALERIPLTRPDVVLMESRLPGMAGIECIQKLNTLVTIPPIVMLTACGDSEDIVMALMVGAVGYLLKPLSKEQLKSTVAYVTNGGAVFCREAKAVLLKCFRHAFALNPKKAFSRRELEIMTCLIEALSDKEISNRLHIAPNTVHVHLVRLFRLLGAHNRDEAVQKFLHLRE